jgi:hypothetical protein
MSALYDALLSLSPVQDPELLDGYRHYESLLTAILTPAQLATYAAYIRRSGTIRIFEEMAPDELSDLTTEENVIALAIMADEHGSMENRRVAALLNQRGQHDVAPDLGATNSIK